MSSSSEAQRERDVQRYFQSWQVAQGSSLNVALNVDSIAESDLRGTGYTAQVSPDKALTAFAQLAVFRLNVKRAMVSLIDGSTQFILAEATRNLKLGDLDTSDADSGSASPTGNNDRSDLWLGTALLSRPDAVCEHCLVDKCTSTDTTDRAYTANGCIVPDCRLDKRFDSRPYVRAENGVRFYAGVPIISRNGHKIGAYAVSDDKPRDGLTKDEIQFMQGVAQAVMEHLEWARDRVDRFKGERIVRGLAAFIEGCSTINEDQAQAAEEDPSTSDSTLRPPEMSLNAGSRQRLPSTSLIEGRSSVLSSSRPSPERPSQGPSASSSLPRKIPPRSKQDSLSRMFNRAAEILRNATLADGVALFGAATSSTKLTGQPNGSYSSENDDHSLNVTSGSEGVGMDSSDSDTSPSGRPCKLLAYSFTDEKARSEIEQGSTLSLGTLEKYYSMFPKGKTFSFTEDGAGVSSEDDSFSDREPGNLANGQTRRRKAKLDHEELLKKIPGAKLVVFVPLFDYTEDRFAGGCFLWTSITGKMMNLDQDLSHLRAFGNSIMNQVGRINTQKNEQAKTTFIASMSHELRSPLHGILGAAEFLKDTNMDTYQSGLINSIFSCGQTLLETLNHVLDYSKINRLGRARMRRAARHNRPINLPPDSLESLNMTASVDLSVLVEEVVDAVSAGHTFKTLPVAISAMSSNTTPATQSGGAEGPVSVLLDICPKISWVVRTQPGALRRIIMNLFGNALKYTASGYVMVSLRGEANLEKGKINAVIRVTDTGKGMSEEFQRDRLFIAFSQEDSFQPGTGLGLSIVKQIVDSLGGSLEVKSQPQRGTEITVRLRLATTPGETERLADPTIQNVLKQTKGLKLTILDSGQNLESNDTSARARKLNEILEETLTNWFGMEVTREGSPDSSNPDLCLYCEPPPAKSLGERIQDARTISPNKRVLPVIVVCLNTEEAVRISKTENKAYAGLSEVLGVIPQPCGPTKLAKVIAQCLERAEALALERRIESSAAKPDPPKQEPPKEDIQPFSSKGDTETKPKPQIQPIKPPPVNTASPVSPPPLDPGTPSLSQAIEHTIPDKPQKSQRKVNVLLVDDNKINLQLLVMFMKKCGFQYQQAENGQEALDKFKEVSLANLDFAALGRPAFDYVLMDISMPVMNGFEATKHIREFEHEYKLPRTSVLALTGLASSDARRDADSVGVDVFLPKPVRFADLKRLLAPGS